ncbi:uncharacterized protein LOC136025759 [Artemia franciscana]|uniref:uncharacterized protein LOC136025759 n=1 Tax=Artemia franciscana TaxID=6661 RepID=UPI0032D9E9C1
MNEEDKKKIKRNLVALEKKLKLDDQFQRLSVQKRMFSQEMMDDIMEEDSPTLHYCMKLMLRGPKAFSKFIDVLIETRQYDIVRLLAPNIDVRSFSESNALGVSMRNVPVQELIPSTSTITHYTGDSFAETEKLYHPPRPRNSSSSLDTPMTSYGLNQVNHYLPLKPYTVTSGFYSEL